jgi:hypothetical protein
VAGRLQYVDHLKVVLIAAIIAIHGVAGYSTLDVWTYGVVREVTLAPVSEIGVVLLIGPFGFFLIALFFLVAGLLTPPSVERKGVGRFVGDRLLRLGLPFVVYVAGIQPAVTYALYRPLGHDTGTYWEELVGDEGQIDTGPLWFVGVLLIFSLAYAAWVASRRRVPAAAGPLQLRHLVVLVVLVAPTTFLIRLVYPAGSEAGFSDLNLWQWPECLAMFGLGLLWWSDGLLTQVPPDVVRVSRRVTAVAAFAFVGLGVAAAATDGVEQLMGGWSPGAALFAGVESALAVFGPLWALDAARRRLDRPLWRGADLSRAAYAAFIVQAPVLIGLSGLLRPLDVVAEVKAVAVAALGVAISFWLGRLLTRLPGLRRIL